MAKTKKRSLGEKTLAEAVEAVIIERRLKEKYPQMFKPGWGKSKPGIVKRTAARLQKFRESLSGGKPKKNIATKAVEGGMANRYGATKKEVERFSKKRK